MSDPRYLPQVNVDWVLRRRGADGWTVRVNLNGGGFLRLLKLTLVIPIPAALLRDGACGKGYLHYDIDRTKETDPKAGGTGGGV